MKLVVGDRVTFKYGAFLRRGRILEIPTEKGLRAKVRLDPLPGEKQPETVLIRLSLLTRLDVVDGVAELDR